MKAPQQAKRRALAPGKHKAGPVRARKPARLRPQKAPRGVTDPVALEVFSNALLSVAEEMGALLIRTAYSINIKERQDASTAIFETTRLGSPADRLNVAP